MTGRALDGAAAAAAYATIEALVAIFTRLFFPERFIPTDRLFLPFLLVAYLLIGAALGRRWFLIALPIAFAANLRGVALIVVGVLAIAILLLRIRNAWMVSAMLVLPLWVATEVVWDWPMPWRGALWLALVLVFGVRWRSHRFESGGVAIALQMVVFAICAVIESPRPAAQPTTKPVQRGPNILLVTLDTVRADHLSLYGYRRDTTPTLRALAKEATVYTRAISPSNMTLASHASIFTGLLGSRHQAHYRHVWMYGSPLPAEANTIAEILADRGYATSAIVANYGYLGSKYGLAQGFHYVDARTPRTSHGNMQTTLLRYPLSAAIRKVVPLWDFEPYTRRADAITDDAIARMDDARRRRRPFFVFVNYMDAHPPYTTRVPGRFTAALADEINARQHSGKLTMTEEERQFLLAQYDAGIEAIDAQLARLIARAGEDALIVITSDHGEAFGEHGVVSHAMSVYEDQIWVPLLIRDSSRTAKVVDTPISTASVFSLLATGALTPMPPIAESFPLGLERSVPPYVRTGRAYVEGTFKLIRNQNGTVELYDLASDPGERKNLANAGKVAAMSAALDRMLAAQPKGLAPAAAVRDQETLRRLRALGYLR